MFVQLVTTQFNGRPELAICDGSTLKNRTAKLTLVSHPAVSNKRSSTMLKFVGYAIVAYQFVLIWACFPILGSSQCMAQKLESHPYLSAPQMRLKAQLQARSVPLVRQELVKNLQFVSGVTKIPIWLDAHVPKDMLVEGDQNTGSEATSIATHETYESVLQRWAEKSEGSLVLLDGIAAIVPASKNEIIHFFIWNSSSDKVFLDWDRAVRDFGWEEGASIRSVGIELSKLARISDNWTDDLEHDLWGAFRFQRVPLKSLSACVLTSMGRLAINHRGRIAVVDYEMDRTWWPQSAMPRDSVGRGTVERELHGENSHGANSHGGESETFANESLAPRDPWLVSWDYSAEDIAEIGTDHCRDWRKRYPNSVISRKPSGAWSILALPSEHRALVEPLAQTRWQRFQSESSSPSVAGSRSPSRSSNGAQSNGRVNSGKESRFSGVMRGTLGQALATMKQSLRLEFSPDTLSDEVSNREISVEYSDVTLLELIDRIAEEAEVEIRQTGPKSFSLEY